VHIIGRKTWGARYPDGFGDAPLPAREVWLHHSATIAPDVVPPFDDDDDAVRTLERIGQDRFKGGISYTFAVTPAGRVYEGHSIGRRGAHTKGRNTIGRAIVLVGNYDQRHPTHAQLTAVAELLVHGRQVGWWPAARLAGGHRDAPGAATACPGQHGHRAIAAINELAARRHGEDDMPLSQNDVDRVADAVLTRLFPNMHGDMVMLTQVLNALEIKTTDVVKTVEQLREHTGRANL
jgi:hypothetical protein